MKWSLIGLISMSGLIALRTYVRWELLTYQHEREFREAIERGLEENMWNPTADFLRVIDYRSRNAQVFTKSGRVEYMVYFRRNHKNEWEQACYDYCKASNGSNRCFFPWYSLGSSWTQVVHYSPNKGCKSKGY